MRLKNSKLINIRFGFGLANNVPERVLIDIPPHGEYIEILGHKITEHCESWEAFVEYLKKCDALEEENRKLKNIIDDFGPGNEVTHIIGDDGKAIDIYDVIEENGKLKDQKYNLECCWAQLIKYLTDYRVKKLREQYGEYDDLKAAEGAYGRYCIALSIDDILAKMAEIEDENI